MPHTVQLRYFAWIRERLGSGEETIELPEGVHTVADLLHWLRKLDDAHAAALADEDTLRVAVDQQHADLQTSISSAREIAFFPPVTGG